MVDFPEPLTPVTQTRLFNGKETSMFLRLFSVAPLILILLFDFLRFLGRGILSFPVK